MEAYTIGLIAVALASISKLVVAAAFTITSVVVVAVIVGGVIMGKQKKKKQQKREKVSKYMRTCERCGNDNFSFKPVFKCRFCGEVNGLEREMD